MDVCVCVCWLFVLDEEPWGVLDEEDVWDFQVHEAGEGSSFIETPARGSLCFVSVSRFNLHQEPGRT